MTRGNTKPGEGEDSVDENNNVPRSPFDSLYFALSMNNSTSKTINSLTQLKRQLKSNVPENSTFEYLSLSSLNNSSPYSALILVRKSDELSQPPVDLSFSNENNDLSELNQIENEIILEENDEKFMSLVNQDISSLIDQINAGNNSDSKLFTTDSDMEDSFLLPPPSSTSSTGIDLVHVSEGENFNKKLNKFNTNKYLKNLNKRDIKTLNFIRTQNFLKFLRILKASPSKKNKQYPLAYEYFNKNCSNLIKKDNLNCSLISFYIKKYTNIYIRSRTLILWKNKMLFKNTTSTSNLIEDSRLIENDDTDLEILRTASFGTLPLKDLNSEKEIIDDKE